ncbi:DNA-binding transcriptional regulator BasR [Raoultella terrigena]|uniref:DNA-binding transcriptional regulator BasR n=1 Tax=Raoultella terrigena TaxID=577 RepID=A0A4V6J2S5_RAOTE|nr:DNA-binding transcriptional regulator BasR [Raoultella terrigena]
MKILVIEDDALLLQGLILAMQSERIRLRRRRQRA